MLKNYSDQNMSKTLLLLLILDVLHNAVSMTLQVPKFISVYRQQIHIKKWQYLFTREINKWLFQATNILFKPYVYC